MNDAPQAAAHFDRPADVAAHIASLPAVIVAGPDSGHAATLAVAVARAAAGARRVALGDLAGDLAAIYALAGGEDAPGLAECFRDGLTMNDIARPAPDIQGLFVLPAGEGVRTEPALASAERWARLIRGFSEAGGLLILVVPERSPLVAVLADAGAALLYAGPAASAPRDAPLTATIGAAIPAALRRTHAGGVPAWQTAMAIIAVTALSGWGAVAYVMAANAPDGSVIVSPALRLGSGGDSNNAAGGTDTVTIVELTPAADTNNLAPFAIEVVAANTAANANSLLRDAEDDGALPAATISVVTVQGGSARVARWHKVMFGAWRELKDADSAIAVLRRRGTVGESGGSVVRTPYAVLLADSTSAERARAVADVWRAKGVTPYAMKQHNGTTRVYAGAFETVAQAVTMAAMVRAAGGSAVVAYRTGRPD